MLEKNTLVMFSGGKDSMLAACKCVERGEFVGLLSFNSGCLVGEQCIQGCASRLVRRYGEARVRYEGIYSTWPINSRLGEWWYKTSQAELADKYPGVDNAQVICLHCQTAMWTAAIAYAVAKGFSTIAAGYRHDDVFCTGSYIYIQDLRDVAAKHNVTIDLPVWDLELPGADWETCRDIELTNHGFYPSVLEPQCTLGRPAYHHIKDIATPLNNYFNEHLKSVMQSRIPKLRETFRHLKLSDQSLNVGEYQVPSGITGLY